MISLIRQQGDEDQESPTKQPHGSPVKTIISKLQRQKGAAGNNTKDGSFKVCNIVYRPLKAIIVSYFVT